MLSLFISTASPCPLAFSKILIVPLKSLEFNFSKNTLDSSSMAWSNLFLLVSLADLKASEIWRMIRAVLAKMAAEVPSANLPRASCASSSAARCCARCLFRKSILFSALFFCSTQLEIFSYFASSCSSVSPSVWARMRFFCSNFHLSF